MKSTCPGVSIMFRAYVVPSSSQGMRTAWLLMVIPRSRSMSMRSRYCARIARASTTPVIWSIRSASVDLPWSMCAMMQKFRISSGGVACGCSAVRAMGDTVLRTSRDVGDGSSHPPMPTGMPVTRPLPGGERGRAPRFGVLMRAIGRGNTPNREMSEPTGAVVTARRGRKPEELPHRRRDVHGVSHVGAHLAERHAPRAAREEERDRLGDRVAVVAGNRVRPDRRVR